jgi:hypothetical protein
LVKGEIEVIVAETAAAPFTATATQQYDLAWIFIFNKTIAFGWMWIAHGGPPSWSVDVNIASLEKGRKRRAKAKKNAKRAIIELLYGDGRFFVPQGLFFVVYYTK